MPRRTSLAVAVLTAAAGLAVAAPRADAVPQHDVREDARVAGAVELARQVSARQQALATLNQRAATRDRALLGRQRVLATYGWTGDPEAARAVLPLAVYRVSAGFGLTGPLWEDEHGGQDFGAAVGEPIVAVAAGTVTDVADAGPYGLRTIVTLPDGTEVWYCHQTTATVLPGQVVDLADVIGTVGSSGNSTGPHLHLEVRPAGGDPVDPMDWLRAAGLTP